MEDGSSNELLLQQNRDAVAHEIAEWMSLQERDWHWAVHRPTLLETASLSSITTSVTELSNTAASSQRINDRQLRLIAIQLLASCYTSLQSPAVPTLPDTSNIRRYSQIHPNNPNLHSGVCAGPSMVSALRLQSQHRFSPAPGTHARDNSVNAAWPGLDGGQSSEEDLTVGVNRRRSLMELENEADKEESLEDFLRWTNDTTLDLEEVSRPRERRGSLPPVVFPQWPQSRTQPCNTTAPNSRSVSRSHSRTGERPTNHQFEDHVYMDGNASREPANHLVAPTGVPKNILMPTRRNLTKAVRDTLKPLQRVASVRPRRHHSNPHIDTPSRGLEAHVVRKASSLEQQKPRNISNPQFYLHVQPHNRRDVLPHISYWAYDVRRASSVAPVDIFQRGRQDARDEFEITAEDFKRYSVPPIEALDDDVSSRCSGALDLLTAEEYLRQTAFDCLDDGRLSLSGAMQSRRAS